MFPSKYKVIFTFFFTFLYSSLRLASRFPQHYYNIKWKDTKNKDTSVVGKWNFHTYIFQWKESRAARRHHHKSLSKFYFLNEKYFRVTRERTAEMIKVLGKIKRRKKNEKFDSIINEMWNESLEVHFIVYFLS